MFNPQMTSSQMELLPLVCLCLLSWSGTTSADQPESVLKEEGSDAVLRCSFGVNIEQEKLEWKKDGQQEVFVYDSGIHHNNGRPGQDEQFKGRVSHFQEELKHGNASILIRNTKVADSGDYTCDIPHDSSHEIVHVKLVVGAAPKPYIKTVDQTENSALLQCEAHGVPDLEVHWQDSDGNILPAEEPQVTERGGLLYITVKTTVNKTDYFSCVATQKKLSHRISTGIYVYIHEAKPQTDYTGWIVAGVFIIALVVVVGFVFYKKLKRELQEQNRIIEEANEKIKKITEGSSDRPAESVPLNPVNSPA